MDSQHWNRTIEENPIANALDVFHSFAKEEGVGDIAAVDRIITNNVRYLASELLFFLRSHPAAKALQGIHGSVSDDLTALSRSVTKGWVGEDSVRRLLKAAIIHQADDKTLWGQVLAFITASRTANYTAKRPMAARSAEPQDQSATATQIATPSINVSEHHSLGLRSQLMDPQDWYRVIEENPIADGLDWFQSIARRKGVCDIAAVDQIITKDVRNLTIELVFCLRSHPAAKFLQGIRGSVSDDLIALSESVIRGLVGEDSARRLLKAAIIKADDKTLWDEVLAFITASPTATGTFTRSPAPRSTELQDGRVTGAQILTPSINVSEHHSFHGATASPDSTVSNHFQSPSQYTTDYETSSSEYREDTNLLLENKLKGRLDIDTPGFLDAFFPSSDYRQTAEKFLDRCKAGVVPAFHNGWDTWPDGAAGTEVVAWLKLVTEELEQFSRASFSSDVSHRRAVLGMPRKPSRDSVAMHELDVGFIPAADLEGGPQSSTYSCARMLARGELRRDPMDDKAQETWLTLAKIAQDMLTAQGTRRFVLGFTLCGSLMRVWLFDRLGGIASEQININTEPLQFIKVILGFLWMSEEDLGFDCSIKGPDLTVDGADGKKRQMDIAKPDGSKECILVGQQPAGKLTSKMIRSPETILVVKDSWQEVKRDEEGDMLLLATRRGVVNVARHYHHETVQIRGMNDDVRACVRRGLDRATASNSAQSDSESSRRAPSERLRKRGTSTNPSTSGKEEDSGLHPRKRICSSSPTGSAHKPRIELPTELGNRVHRRVIVRDYGKAIYKASSRQALLACLEGCIKGHQSLYEAGILHRDISIINLRINEESKKQNQSWPHFLIDLDHAIEIGRKDASTERTNIGTRPFMAIGVLRGEEHSFLHDLESFFWVLFWTCIHHGKSGKESRKSSYFDKWNYYNDLDLALAKV
ncbi:hypothetical protein E4U30_001166 [Claviceps sp. LM220 group G6]|nr:hypothetical protein E4U30_001166 [Claviceps sp. LM220 group G6]